MTDPVVSMFRRDEKLRNMPDRGRVERPGEGEPVWDPDTNDYEDPEPTTVIEEGPCRFVPVDTGERVVESAGQMVVLAAYEVSFPWDVPVPREGDTVVAVESSDPALEDGTELRVMDVPMSSWLTRRKLIARYQHED